MPGSRRRGEGTTYAGDSTRSCDRCVSAGRAVYVVGMGERMIRLTAAGSCFGEVVIERSLHWRDRGPCTPTLSQQRGGRRGQVRLSRKLREEGKTWVEIANIFRG